jgi:ferrochelatase
MGEPKGTATLLGLLLALCTGASGWRAPAGQPQLARVGRDVSTIRAVATPLPSGVGAAQPARVGRPLAAATPSASAGRASGADSIGILLLNLGGPDSLDAVEPFLYNLFSDPEIITLPKPIAWLGKPIAFCIAKFRAPASREGYAAIGGCSPLLATTRDQAVALEHALAAKGIPARAYVAMRYWFPFTKDAVREVLDAGHRELVILPLYPQFSVSTSGSSLRVLEDIYYADPEFARMQSIVIPAWCARGGRDRGGGGGSAGRGA